MKIVVGPAKRDGDRRVIFEGSLEGSGCSARDDQGVAVSVIADPIHKANPRYRMKSHYRYDIVFTPAELAALMQGVDQGNIAV